MTPQGTVEPILDPGLPIIDTHHHLWFRHLPTAFAVDPQEPPESQAFARMFRDHARYLFDELLADIGSGHNIRATVYVEARAMYLANGPQTMRSVGEVEFVNGVAAMSASGLFGDVRACAGIVSGGIDLRMGDAVADVLEAHIRAGGSRYRGLRAANITYDDDPRVMRNMPGVAHVLLDPRFRRGFSHLHRLGLSCDIWAYEPQLPNVTDLARAFPDTSIILNHTGGPLGVGQYVGRRSERLSIWRSNLRALAECPNVCIKVGGLGTPVFGFPSSLSPQPASSAQLAEEWRPYVETCIEVFGADRCMFESNYPVNSAAAPYAVIWNAFKRIVAGASASEKAALFAGTAARVYRLDIP